ncbi:hypothetical protein PPH41_29630 [Burkholderia gladioli]|nr:hypothetical protein [Burkholderia gladioli]
MKIRTGRAVAAGILIGLSLTATGADAQLGDMLKQAGGSATQNSGGLAGNLGGLGGALGGGGSSLMPSSLGNVAGVLQFCIQNQYLGSGGASSVKDQLQGNERHGERLRVADHGVASPGYLRRVGRSRSAERRRCTRGRPGCRAASRASAPRGLFVAA